jgi:hypothetical protein
VGFSLHILFEAALFEAALFEAALFEAVLPLFFEAISFCPELVPFFFEVILLVFELLLFFERKEYAMILISFFCVY